MQAMKHKIVKCRVKKLSKDKAHMGVLHSAK